MEEVGEKVIDPKNNNNGSVKLFVKGIRCVKVLSEQLLILLTTIYR